jgi:hypothetical protein
MVECRITPIASQTSYPRVVPPRRINQEPAMSLQEVLGYVRAQQPLRPFRILMVCSRIGDVRHPERVRVGKTGLVIVSSARDDPEVFGPWGRAWLGLVVSLSPREASVA